MHARLDDLVRFRGPKLFQNCGAPQDIGEIRYYLPVDAVHRQRQPLTDRRGGGGDCWKSPGGVQSLKLNNGFHQTEKFRVTSELSGGEAGDCAK